MSRQGLFRWAGLAGVVSGVLLVVTEVVSWVVIGNQPTSAVAESSAFFVIMVLGVLVAYLALLALVGLYARQASVTGGLGLAAFVIAFLGTALTTGAYWGAAFLVTSLAGPAPQAVDALDAAPPWPLAVGWISATLILALGWILFGIVSLRAKVVPSLPAWLLIIGTIVMLLLDLLGVVASGVIFGVALAWLGWWLWSEREVSPA
jgi:hypothetical protein